MDSDLQEIIKHSIFKYLEIDLYQSDNWIMIISVVTFSWLLFTVLTKKYVIYSENSSSIQEKNNFWSFMILVKQILLLCSLILAIIYFRHDFTGFLKNY